MSRQIAFDIFLKNEIKQVFLEHFQILEAIRIRKFCNLNILTIVILNTHIHCFFQLKQRIVQYTYITSHEFLLVTGVQIRVSYLFDLHTVQLKIVSF